VSVKSPDANLADIAAAAQTPTMLKRTIQSPWFPFGAAALFAGLALALEAERMWLLGLAGTAAFWGCVDWVGGTFGSGEVHREARVDTTNKRGPNDG
jgi:hypothetical protein